MEMNKGERRLVAGGHHAEACRSFRLRTDGRTRQAHDALKRTPEYQPIRRFIVVYPAVTDEGHIAINSVRFGTIIGAIAYMTKHDDRPNVLIPCRALTTEEENEVREAMKLVGNGRRGPWNVTQWVKAQERKEG